MLSCRTGLGTLTRQLEPHRHHVRMFALSAHRQAQPKTFANQALLPRLPIPELEQSLQGYLESLRPVLEQKVAAWLHGAGADYARLVRASQRRKGARETAGDCE
jgi:hypothetical protein